jgi:hypothetical protein
MKFLNLETGYSFDALWKVKTENGHEQTKGYIFWFPNEQSIGITYTMPIAVITDKNEPLLLEIEENNIFSFIASTETETNINGYSFSGEPIYSKTMSTTPEEVNGKYVHVFNIACKSDNANEYICKINIGNEGFIRVGADFYGEHEPAYINLSNMGVELPLGIQKAIYTSNVHEDYTDNILLNRKFKELLSNYWDVIANKGSIKSLINSLKWFEWDNLELREVYKYSNAGKIMFSERNLTTSLNEVAEIALTNTLKTSYVSLYCALQNEMPSYDNQLNPVLEKAVFKWSIEDIKLKIALLAKFFGVNFLPIHLAILHATVEDKVFTNTIKVLHGSKIKRTDEFYDFDYIECNINETDSFKLTNVRAQVTNDTIYGVKYPLTHTFGVDIFPTDAMVTDNDEDIKTFSTQYYTGPGAIIPVSLIIPNRIPTDFVKQTIIDYIDDSGKDVRLKFNDIFTTVLNSETNSYEIHIDFKFLAKVARVYELHFTFITGSSKTITRKVNINVEDTDSMCINVYKVRSKDDSKGFTKDDFYNTETSKYFLKIQDCENTYYTQYLPYLDTLDKDYTGIKLNLTMAFNCINPTPGTENMLLQCLTYRNNFDEDPFYYITDNFLIFKKYDDNGYLKAFILVSKKFVDTNTKKHIEDTVIVHLASWNVFNDRNPDVQLRVQRADLGFYPQFHELVHINGNSLEDYTVKPYEALACIVKTNNEQNTNDFKYGHMITDAEWTFYNVLTDKTVIHPSSSQQPFIADTENSIMKPGYYDITFRYSLNNGITNECKLSSAFRIKN